MPNGPIFPGPPSAPAAGDGSASGGSPSGSAEKQSVATAKGAFPDSKSSAVAPCPPEPGKKKAPSKPAACTAKQMKDNIAKCDGGTGIWKKATSGLGKEPTVRVAGAAGGFGGHADSAKGEAVIAPNPDCCGATQTLIHELTNLSHTKDFAKLSARAGAGDLGREDYTKENERLEYNGVKNALNAFDKCKSTWGCAKGSVARHEWIRSSKNFDDYYNNHLGKRHKDYFRSSWDRNYKGAYDKKHAKKK
jgi:hypothetical protein